MHGAGSIPALRGLRAWTWRSNQVLVSVLLVLLRLWICLYYVWVFYICACGVSSLHRLDLHSCMQSDAAGHRSLNPIQ